MERAASVCMASARAEFASRPMLRSSHIGDNGNPAMLRHYRWCLFSGLTTAIMLAQRGWKGITVYDKRAPPPPVESDVGLAPRFSPALRASYGKVQDRQPGN
jgi:hypothetical protein